jgi:hypothetical protein
MGRNINLEAVRDASGVEASRRSGLGQREVETGRGHRHLLVSWGTPYARQHAQHQKLHQQW